MALALIVLWVALVALAATIGLVFGVRTAGSVLHRRSRRYAAQIRTSLGAFAAQVGAPPSAPRTTMQRRLMQRDLLALRPNLKGRAGEELTRLFVSFGLARDARQALRSRSVVSRRRAAEILAAMPGAQDESDLVAGLADPDRLVRLACARALVDGQNHHLVPEVVTALADEADHPQDAVGILADFGTSAVPALRQVLVRDAPVAQQRLATRALGAGHATSAVLELRALLGHQDPALLADAVRALGVIGDRRCVERLCVLAESHPQTAVRVQVCTALGRIEDPAARPPLARCLSDGRWGVREAAAQALRSLGSDQAPMAVMHAEPTVSAVGAAHLAGVLDVAGQLRPVIVRAQEGDAPADQFVRRACAGGASVRVAELAAGQGLLATYCTDVLATTELEAVES